MQFKRLLLMTTFLFNLLLAGFAQEPTLLEHGGGVRTVEFSPVNASLVASAGESNIIKLWNLQNDTVQTLGGHTGIVNVVAFSPNGELLASGGEDSTIKVWNVHNQQNIATFQHSDAVKSLTFSPNGRILATGGDEHVKLWNVRDWTEIATLRHEAWVRALVFSPDGQFLAAGKGHEGPGIVTVWNVQTRQVIATLEGDSNRVRTLAFSPDNRILASSGRDRKLKLWSVSNWELLNTIPHAGEYEITFSPDGKMLAGTNNGYVNLWWVEDGAGVAQLPGPTGWIHPVDFSHDGTSLAVGGEDGIVRIWRINTSPIDGREEGAVQILHIDTYLQQLPKANSANGDNIPEPAPPPAVVRDFFDLDPFYEQWINIEGFPVVASAKVNPYALKEAAWVIWKMIGHRRDVLRAIVEKKSRLLVIGYTEIITEFPDYPSDSVYTDFLVYRRKGLPNTELGGLILVCPEENILSYPGNHSRHYNVLIHGVAHGLHLSGLNTLDPTFDERLQITYKAAMEKGLWQGTYASTDSTEYWAEGTQAWFNPKGINSFRHFGNTRRALKRYDPGLARLLTEIYGDTQWRYTPVAERTHLPHLQGFNPQESPTYEGRPDLKALYQQLYDPNSDGGGAWINVKLYDPNQLPRLTNSRVLGDRSTIICVNFSQVDVLVYSVDPDGTEKFWARLHPGRIRYTRSRMNAVWIVKNTHGRNLAVFQVEGKIGRAAIGTVPNKTDRVTTETSLDKITGPWLWMIAPTKVGQGGANSNNIDSLAIVSGGDVTEADVAANGAREGDAVGNYAWTLGEIAATGGNNVNDLLNEIGLAKGDINDHSSYALITLESTTAQSGVTMRAGSDDSIKVWLNGEVVHNNPINRGAQDLQDTFKVDLKQGDNLLLVKVSEREETWSMFVGIDADVKAVYKIPSDTDNIETTGDQPADINEDGSVNVTDLLLVVTALSENATPHRRADVNGDGSVNVADLLLVVENLDDPVNAAAPTSADIVTSLNPAILAGQLNILRAENDGSRKYQNAIAFLQSLLAVTRPDETQLLANYPNPFNPETWIPYQLAKPANVKISIYAADGKLVRRLDLGHQTAGIYESRNRAAYWDGRNTLGEPVASGVYFYTLSAGDFTATRKMLIRK